MDEITLRRLLFSKRLFSHGVQHSNKNTEPDRFLAMHHFDNSIELFLKIVATQEGIIKTVKEDWKLKDLWGEINTKLKQKISGFELPLKDQIFTLHEIRNLAQHQGDSPSFETVVKYQGYTRDFLIRSFKDVFKIDFNKVFAASLVEKLKIREALVESEKYIEEKNFKESIESSAKAFAYLEQNERANLFSHSLGMFTLRGVLDEHSQIRFPSISFDSSEQKFIEQITPVINELNKLLDERARKINEFARALRSLESEFTMLKLGVDIKEYKRFNKISPFALFDSNSPDADVSVGFDEEQLDNCNEENARFCHDFVLDAALMLQ
jgi:hypothetical protein